MLLLSAMSNAVSGEETYFSFYPSWASEPQEATFSVALGDVDGDGDLDLVCGNIGQNTLYLNTSGTFETSHSWASEKTDDTRGVALGDVNGDRNLDLVCGNYGQSNTLYLNTGGTFETSPSWSSGPTEYARSVALGDVNGDGNLDLVCGNNGHNALYLNTGSTFETWPSWTSEPTEDTRGVALGDVDGDGDLDLVCGNIGHNALYLNTGSTFEIWPSWTSEAMQNAESVSLGDVDGDGDLDLVCGNIGQSNALYLNTGGTFETSPSWSSGPTEYTRSVALGDVDGDDDLDLVCGNYGQSNSLHSNTGGVFGTSPSWSSEPTGYTRSIALGDVDGDGDLDLVCGNYGQSNTLYLNIGGVFGTSPSWSSRPTENTRSIALGDVDGDDDLDLVCGNYGQSNTLHLNTGGVFGTSPSWSSGPTETTRSIDLGDVDGDGDLDLICGNHDESNTLYLNAGATFETSPLWASDSTEYTLSVALGDVDGDGDLDLVCGNHNEGNTLHLNTGGTFEGSPFWTSTSTETAAGVALGDVDGDGDLDPVFGSYGQGNTLYLNTGGTFENSPSWASGSKEYTLGVALGDVDGDGDLDLVCGNYGLSTLYLNTGGTFESSPSWASGRTEDTRSVALGDVDGDGDLDLVFGSYGQGITLYLNAGGTSESSPSWASGSTEDTRSVALGDVDGDGDLDLVCGNYGQSNTLYAARVAPIFKGDPLFPNKHLPNNGAFLRSVTAERIGEEYYRLHFMAVDVESDPAWVLAEYHYEGDPTWHPMIFGGQTGRTGPWKTSPAGVADSLDWDTHLLPFDSRAVILRLRVIEIPKRVSVIQHVAPYLKAIGPITPYRPVISAPGVLRFPSVTLGDTTSAVLTVSNVGTATLTITSVDTPSPDMRIAEVFPIQIAPGSSAGLTLLFAPSSDADLENRVVLENNDSFSPSTLVVVTADVRALDFTPANLYPSGEVPEGTPLSVLLVMQDSVQVSSARVFYREGGKASFDVTPLQRTGNPVNEQWYGSVPGSSITARGIEYFVEVYNGRFSRRGELQRFRTRVKNLKFASVPPAERYGMISVPLEIDSPILGVLSDDLGGADITKWRMWGYYGLARSEAAGSYVELPNDSITDFEVGRGYWLVTRGNHAIDTGPAEGLSTPTDGAFAVVLGPGWNMIGNPFNFAVAWDSIAVDGKPMSEAEATAVDPPVGWVGNQYEYDVRVLEQWEGYWVKNLGDTRVVLSIPPKEAGGEAAADGPTNVARDADNGESDDRWTIGVLASSEHAKDGYNYLGVKEGAENTWDRFDRAEAPMSPGNAISLYFPHTEWGKRPDRYAVDIRGNSEATNPNASSPLEATDAPRGCRWSFDVAKNYSRGAGGDEVVLEFSGLEGIPAEAEALLIDRELERLADLREDHRYAYFEGKRDFVKREDDARFVLLVGSEEFVDSHGEDLPSLPTKTVLHQNHPNPFNPTTVIRYGLATAGMVHLRIYDARGALVKELYAGRRPPGRYEVGWDGENDRGERVASGVYFTVLETPEGRQTKKIVCVK